MNVVILWPVICPRLPTKWLAEPRFKPIVDGPGLLIPGPFLRGRLIKAGAQKPFLQPCREKQEGPRLKCKHCFLGRSMLFGVNNVKSFPVLSWDPDRSGSGLDLLTHDLG